MRPVSVTVSSAANSAWIPLSNKQTPFNVSLGVTLDNAASGITYSVQHTFDQLGNKQYPASITRSGTVATVTLTAHGLRVGDSVIVAAAGAPLDGTYAVASVVDANTFTYTVANSGATAASPGAWLIPLRVFNHDVLAGKVVSAQDNYAFPITAVRLSLSAWGAGSATLTVTQCGVP